MSAKREKKRRYNLKLEYIARYEDWLKCEPPKWRFIAWRRWKASRPIWDDSKDPVSQWWKGGAF